MTAPVRYEAPPADGLRIVPLDTLTAIFHRASGQTHVVASPIPELLDSLSVWPRTEAELLAELATRFDLPDGDSEALRARLGELEAVGLIARR